MGQSLVQIYVHLVFSTKNRQPILQEFRTRLHGYLAGTAQNLNCPPLEIGGVEDHVHVLCRLSKQIAVSELIAELKRESSKWVKEVRPNLPGFYWQNGYGAFSVSPKHVKPLMQYIANQAEHHRTETFQDEFRRLCRPEWNRDRRTVCMGLRGCCVVGRARVRL